MLHYRNGATEVHMLFDNPKCHSLKHFEWLKRDRANPVPDTHFCSEFSADLLVPPNWNQEVLSCRKCKRNLVIFLAQYFLQKMKHNLRLEQKFVTAGGFIGAQENQAMSIHGRGVPCDEPQLLCDAEESDTQIWLHVMNVTSTNVLVLSPDMDVYHIGLPIVANSSHHVLVRVSKFNERELKLVDMQALINAFHDDPSLASIPMSLIPQTLQVLFVCTGCDFISFFHGLGKFKCFF